MGRPVNNRHGLARGRGGGVAVFFLLLAALALYQPVLHATTHLPGTARDPTTDYFHFHWNYWWLRHALTTPNLHIYETDYVLAPHTNSLALHTLTPVWFPLWALIEPLAGTVPAMTAIMIVSVALSGLAFYALLRHVSVSPGLALAGGSLLALSPIMRNGVFWTNINLMGWFWLPVLILVADRITGADRARRFRAAAGWALVLGVAAWGMMLTDLQYPMLVGWVVLPYGFWTLWNAPNWRVRARLVSWTGLALIGWGALLWWLGPLPYLLDYERGPTAPLPAERALSIPFPEGFLWRVTDRVATVSLGALVLPLIGLALVLNVYARRRKVALPPERWFWLALVPGPLVLSAGASITVFGTSITLPYRWFHDLLDGMFRYPERFAPVIVMAGLVFALQTLTPWVARIRTPGFRVVVLAALVLLVVADGRVFFPLAIQSIPPEYAIYTQMGREPYDYVVLEVPTGVSSGEGIVGQAEYAALQWYGTVHGKRMINGHLSRVDVLHYWYLSTDDPALAWLGQRRMLEPDAVEARLRTIIDEYPVGYIVVHTDLIERYTGESTVREVVAYLNSLLDLLCPVAAEGPVVTYRTAWHPDGCQPRTPPADESGAYRLDMGAPGDAPFVGTGWYWAEEIVPGIDARWTGDGVRARLYVELPPGDYRVTLAAQAYGADRALTLLAGVQELGTASVPASGLTEVSFPLTVLNPGNLIALDLDAGEPVPVPGAERALAVMVDWVRFARVE